MEAVADQFLDILRGLFGLADQGFDGVNQVMGLIIAAVAAFLMAGWKRLGPVAVAATLVHVLLTALLPVLDGAAFRLPDLMSLSFWLTALALFFGYLIVIAVFFFLKSLFVGAPGGKKAGAH